jgi:hypothetical protein
MDGITTAIVGFIFVCIVFPKLVRNRTQFYAAFGIIVIMLFLGTLGGIFGYDSKFRTLLITINGFLQLIALVMIVLATGGLSLGELTGEFKNALEVIRRGETEKEIIIPLSGQSPKVRRTIEEEEAALDAAEGRTFHVIDPPAVPPTPASPPRKPEAGQIPLD